MGISQTDVVRRFVGSRLKARKCRFRAQSIVLMSGVSRPSRDLFRKQTFVLSRDDFILPSRHFGTPRIRLLPELARKGAVRTRGAFVGDPAPGTPDDSEGANGDKEPFAEEMGEVVASTTPLTEPPVISERLHVLEPKTGLSATPSRTSDTTLFTTESSSGSGQLSEQSLGARVETKDLGCVSAPVVAPSSGVPWQKDEEEKDHEDEEPAWLPHRWKVTLMMGLAFVLCNMDKVNMSVAVIPMAHELGWNSTSRGLVQSAFFWGYTLTQIPAGWISTRVGGAAVLLCGVVLWSLGTFVAPSAAQFGLVFLCASRILVGLGEGFAPAAVTNVLARQIPESERARAVSTVFGGLDLGSAVGLLLCGPLIRIFGWPCVFYLFAFAGILWCFAWPSTKPEKQDSAMRRKAGTTEDKTVQGEQQGEHKVPWEQFLQSGPVWAVVTAHFCFNWGYYTLLAWLPSYFELALHLDIQNSSFLTVIPYIAMTTMTPM